MVVAVKRLKIFFLAFVSMWASVAVAQTARPRLVVTSAIDGLQPDHLAALTNRFDKGGFRKLTEGVALPATQCRYVSGGAATDFASLMTGTWPYYHGIIGEQRYDFVEDHLVPIVYDGRYHGMPWCLADIQPMPLFGSTTKPGVWLQPTSTNMVCRHGPTR